MFSASASILRILIGAMLAVSGFMKLIEPYQNFVHTIEIYDIIPVQAANIVAMTLPWAEFITGIFLIAGLWMRFSVTAAWLMFGCFVIVVGQALIRRLPIESCGCFGDGVHIPPMMVLTADFLIWLFLSYCIRNRSAAVRWSFDAGRS